MQIAKSAVEMNSMQMNGMTKAQAFRESSAHDYTNGYLEYLQILSLIAESILGVENFPKE